LKGHVLAGAFTVIGKSFLGKAFHNTIKARSAELRDETRRNGVSTRVSRVTHHLAGCAQVGIGIVVRRRGVVASTECY